MRGGFLSASRDRSIRSTLIIEIREGVDINARFYSVLRDYIFRVV